MPNRLRLIDMPDFLPLGEPGSDEELACALGTFTDEAANLDFVRHLARLATEHQSATPGAVSGESAVKSA